MSTWEAITWDVARAGGLTAYVLLALSVVVGLALSLHWQSPRWPRIINSELHNFLTLLATIFTGIHVLAVIIDPYTHFGLNEILLPFVSHYRPIWMAFGIVALYLGIAIGISTWLRPHIGYTLWRRLHVFTLLLFGLVTVHGIATGSDTRNWWALGIYIISAAFVSVLLYLRLRASFSGSKHKQPHTPRVASPLPPSRGGERRPQPQAQPARNMVAAVQPQMPHNVHQATTLPQR